MNLIELTDTKGCKVLINTDKINYIYQMGTVSRIFFGGAGEDYDFIDFKIMSKKDIGKLLKV